MYLKDKKTVTIGSIITKCGNNILDDIKAKVSEKMSTGSFKIYILNRGNHYYMRSDFTIRGFDEEILFNCKPIKKIKYKRKRYKNG